MMCGLQGARPKPNQIEPVAMPAHQLGSALVEAGESGRSLAEGDRVVTPEGFIARIVKYRSGQGEGEPGGGGVVDLAVAGMTDRIGVTVASCRAVPTLGQFLQQLKGGELLGNIAPPELIPQAAAKGAAGQHAAAGSSPGTPAKGSIAPPVGIAMGSPAPIKVRTRQHTALFELTPEKYRHGPGAEHQPGR